MRGQDCRATLLLLICLLTAISHSVYGQANSADVLSVTSRLVVVDVVVKDQDQSFLKGLKAENFQLREDNRSQTITSFEEHSGTSADKPASSAPTLSAFTNVHQNNENSTNIVLLDLLNTPLLQQSYARSQMLAFLKALPPSYRCALFVLNSFGLHQIAPVQSSAEDLAAIASATNITQTRFSQTEGEGERQQDLITRQSLASGGTANVAAGGGLPGFPGGVLTSVQSRLTQALDMEQNYLYEVDAQQTTQAFENLARVLNAYPGRKNLLWLAAQFPLGAGVLLQTDAPVSLLPHTIPNAAGDLPTAFVNSETAIYRSASQGWLLQTSARRSLEKLKPM